MPNPLAKSDRTFTSSREALQDAFKSSLLTEIKKAYKTRQLATPIDQRKELTITSALPMEYFHIEDNCSYLIDRFVGLEIFLPASENHYFRDNRAAHAAVSYLLSAAHTYHIYQTAQRYEHEKSVTMNWNTIAQANAKLYCIQPQQLADHIKPAYHAIAILKPNYLPLPPEILSFETAHEVSRKRNIILGIN